MEGTTLSGIGAASAVLGRDLVSEVRGGAVFGDTAAIPDRPDDWDPLETSTMLAVRGGKRRQRHR